MKAYRIKDWDEIYENNRSRTVKECRWVAIPNRHDGEGFKRVMRHDRASDIFTAFVLILQVASRCQPRGSLVRDGRPHDADSLALKTSGRREWFEIALEVLSAPDIGWIESFDVPDSQANACDYQQTVSSLSADCHPPASQVTKEWKGMKEGDGKPPAKLSAADTVKHDGELKRVNRELERLGTLRDHDKGSKDYNRILELRQRQTELRTILGVKA
jgi:hypothetical protein